jgi:hypothetical protein
MLVLLGLGILDKSVKLTVLQYEGALVEFAC